VGDLALRVFGRISHGYELATAGRLGPRASGWCERLSVEVGT
jgi:hypothetical protein